MRTYSAMQIYALVVILIVNEDIDVLLDVHVGYNNYLYSSGIIF